jgi:hypothetical protein
VGCGRNFADWRKEAEKELIHACILDSGLKAFIKDLPNEYVSNCEDPRFCPLFFLKKFF